MRARLAAFAVMGFLGWLVLPAFAARATEPVLAKQYYFKNWATACDNGGLCRAVSLPSDVRDEPVLQIIVTLAVGKDDQSKLQFYPLTEARDGYRLSVDKADLASGKIVDSDGAFEFSGTEAIRIARILARGKMATLHDQDGKRIASASLAGASAAFRKMDALAGRNGTIRALVARGKRRGINVPPPLPVIEVEPAGPEDAIPDISAMVALAENSVCAEERSGVIEDRAYSLGNGGGVAKALVLIGCGSGAYNLSSAIYIADQKPDKSWQFQPASFDFLIKPQLLTAQPPLVVDASWDSFKRTLASHNKSRGVGDCGLKTEFVWDGKAFRLIGATGMEECRNAPDWLPLWRAAVENKK